MRLLDPRRLTGPNLYDDAPVVLVELGLDAGEDLARAAGAYLAELGRMRAACGLAPGVEPRQRAFQGGCAVAFPAPIDTMLAVTEMAEWAALSACEVLAGRPALALEPKRAEVAAMLEAQRNPALLALQAEAARRGLPFLWDDKLFTLGAGARSRTWPLGEAPPVEQVPWAELGSVPTALISGTNGKTTSARLLARVALEAGLQPGTTSTDGASLGRVVLEEGDMTGPAAARLVLRDARTQVAVLETARGGIMRRGLAVDRADAALLTNVSSDHLGDYGIDDLPAMARAKGVIGQVVHPGGRVVLNALDPHLLALAREPGFRAPVVLFSRDAEAPALRQHRARGGEAWFAREGALWRAKGPEEVRLLGVEEVPLTFGGKALHNVDNALGVLATAAALGLPEAAALAALRAFGNSADNPRRANVFDLGGVTVLLDFGHNPAAVQAALALGRALQPGGRLAVITGHAGDRTGDDLAGVSRTIVGYGPARVWLRDLDGYLRGRAPGEVPELMRRELLGLGLPGEALEVAPSEVEALRRALDWARPGDLVALLVHLDEEGAPALLRERGAKARG